MGEITLPETFPEVRKSCKDCGYCQFYCDFLQRARKMQDREVGPDVRSRGKARGENPLCGTGRIARREIEVCGKGRKKDQNEKGRKETRHGDGTSRECGKTGCRCLEKPRRTRGKISDVGS